jgi:dolichol-phosphate mannosyltransferase
MRAIVIIPTYNERENLARLIPALLAQEPPLDILVVDDNSPDGTGDLAETFARATSRVRVLHRAGKQGLGTAYLAGFRQALAHGYEYIIEMDADFSHDPADLPRLLAAAERDQADLVLGSRWVQGGGIRNWPYLRQLISRGGSLYARCILGVAVRDLTGGFKCFRRRVLESLDLDSVRTSGYGFQIELTYYALRAGFEVREIPIIFTERVHGTSKMSGRIVAEAMVAVWMLRLTDMWRSAAAAPGRWRASLRGPARDL